jgi:hypothetical protein
VNGEPLAVAAFTRVALGDAAAAGVLAADGEASVLGTLPPVLGTGATPFGLVETSPTFSRIGPPSASASVAAYAPFEEDQSALQIGAKAEEKPASRMLNKMRRQGYLPIV